MHCGRYGWEDSDLVSPKHNQREPRGEYLIFKFATRTDYDLDLDIRVYRKQVETSAHSK